MTGALKSFPSAEILVQETAEWLAGALNREVRDHGKAMLVLSGGNTPRSVYELLGRGEHCGRIDWANVHLFWGDERSVPPDHPESNFRMVKQSLLTCPDIPPGNVHRIRAERPPAEAAAAYEEEIREVYRLGRDELPKFSIFLLGLGQDGHTASLFAGTSALQERRKLVTEVYAASLAAWRITMTLPVINNAGIILFLVSGSEKAGILRSVLEGVPPRYPAQMIEPAGGQLLWFADAEATSQLSTVNHA